VTDARAIWQRLETLHALTYFAEESRDAARAAGLKGFWMGYFGFRAAPMGPVDAATVERAVFNFAPAMVARAIPDAWDHASPEALVATRSRAAAAALRRVLPEVDELAGKVNPSLDAVVLSAEPTGPLSAANATLPRPDDPVEDLWQLTTTLREHRGDAHVTLLRESGVDGCEAHHLHAAEHGTPHEILKDSRGWTDHEWAAADARLAARGLVLAGELTQEGHGVRHRIEQETDRRAQIPFDAALDHRQIAHLHGELTRPARVVARGGVIPFPNPMGLELIED